jgi:alkylation response protein AidB-like acyl-CoA dehydrogenase
MKNDTRQLNIVIDARRFAENVIRPKAGQFDKEERYPKEITIKLAERRFLLASLPKANGGLGLDPLYYGFFTEEIGKACCATRGLITVQSSLIGETLLRWGTKEQKTNWLPAIADGQKIGSFALTEPHVGSNAQGVQTTYERSGKKYVIRGRKKWISFAEIADFFIVIASKGPEIAAFIIERNRPGIKIFPQKGLLAGRATHIAEVEFNNVHVPQNNVLGKPGSGFAFIASTALDHGRYSIAWAGVAIAQEALNNMVRYARNRKQFGNKIAEFQLIQGMIGDAVTKTHAARALCTKAGEMRKSKDKDAMAETSIAKYYSSQVALEVATDAVQIYGGNGLSDLYPVERLFRESKALQIIEGTSQIQQQIIARYGLRKY